MLKKRSVGGDDCIAILGDIEKGLASRAHDLVKGQAMGRVTFGLAQALACFSMVGWACRIQPDLPGHRVSWSENGTISKDGDNTFFYTKKSSCLF